MAHLKEPPASDALQGEVHPFRSRIRDLDRSGSEQPLREREEYFRSMFAHAPIGMAVRTFGDPGPDPPTGSS